MEWKDIYALWKSGRLGSEKTINSSIIPKSIRCNLCEEGYYVYDFNWVNNEVLNETKEILNNNPMLDRKHSARPSMALAGTMLTARMLVNATTEEEVAAIWIAAISREACRKCDEESPIYKHITAFYDTASTFLFQNNFCTWRHFHTSVVPDYSTSYKDSYKMRDKSKSEIYSSVQEAMNFVQEYAFEVANKCTIIEFTSLKSDNSESKEFLSFKRLNTIGFDDF